MMENKMSTKEERRLLQNETEVTIHEAVNETVKILLPLSGEARRRVIGSVLALFGFEALSE